MKGADTTWVLAEFTKDRSARFTLALGPALAVSKAATAAVESRSFAVTYANMRPILDVRGVIFSPHASALPVSWPSVRAAFKAFFWGTMGFAEAGIARIVLKRGWAWIISASATLHAD